MFLASLAHDTKNIVLGTGTINMPNTHPAAIAAQVAMLDHILEGPLHHGHQPGRPDVGRRGVRQLPEEPQCDVRREHQHGAQDLGERRAARPAGRVLQGLHQADGDSGDRPGPDPQALPAAASAHRRHRRGAVLAGRHRDGQARLAADLGQLPAARVGEAPIGPSTSKVATPSARAAHPSEWRVAKSIFVADDEATAQRYGKSAEGPYHFYFKQLSRKLVGGGRSQPVQAGPERSPTARSRPST